MHPDIAHAAKIRPLRNGYPNDMSKCRNDMSKCQNSEPPRWKPNNLRTIPNSRKFVTEAFLRCPGCRVQLSVLNCRYRASRLIMPKIKPRPRFKPVASTTASPQLREIKRVPVFFRMLMVVFSLIKCCTTYACGSVFRIVSRGYQLKECGILGTVLFSLTV